MPAPDPQARAFRHRLARVQEQPSLRTSFTTTSLIALGLGTVIGAGIMIVVGQAAAEYAGPGLVLSLVIAGVVVSLCGLCYARLSSVLPISGGSYAYAHTVIGPTAGWTVALGIGLEYLLGAGVLAIGFGAYLENMLSGLGLGLPGALSESWLDGSGGGANLPAAVITLAVGWLLIEGIRESARVSTAIVALKVVALLLFVAVGSFFVDPGNWSPFVPERTGDSFGAIGVLQAVSVVFFSYIGFDVVTNAGRETANPTRSVPRAVVGVLVIATVLYIGVGLVLTGLVPFERLDVSDPLAVALRPYPELDWLEQLINVAAVLGLPVGVLAYLLALSRMSMRLGADGILPQAIGRIDPRRHLPRRATIGATLAIAAVAALLPLELLATATSAGTLVAFIAICVATLLLRRRAAGAGLPEGLHLSWAVPALGIIGCAILLVVLPLEAKLAAGAWLAAGFVIWLAGLRRRAMRALDDGAASDG